MVIVGRIGLPLGRRRNVGDGQIFLASPTSDNQALSNPADHGYRGSDCTAFGGVGGRLSVQVVRLAKRIFVDCHRTNDLWPSSMRFRAPSETPPTPLS